MGVRGDKRDAGSPLILTMSLLTGFLLVLLAGVLQGTFVLPMTLVRGWKWEHTWATFSLLGMFIFNWLVVIALVPNIFAVYSAAPPRDLLILTLFGAGWGVGAVLFGLGMEKLGMALGYPIIMGLIASLGAVIPLLVFFPETLVTTRGLVLLGGTGLVILGIVLCSLGGSKRGSSKSVSDSFVGGLAIAIAAGVLSCLPNVGAAFGSNLTRVAEAMGIAPGAAANTVWALLFTLGFVVNFGYCGFLMIKRGTASEYCSVETKRNLGLSTMMALMWIGSFYLYGAGAARLGRWGVIAGWPLFISLSILVGNLWGFWRGEWRGAPLSARRWLSAGMVTLIVAVVIVALSNSA